MLCLGGLLQPLLKRSALYAVRVPVSILRRALADVKASWTLDLRFPQGNCGVPRGRPRGPSQHWVQSVEPQDAHEVPAVDQAGVQADGSRPLATIPGLHVRFDLLVLPQELEVVPLAVGVHVLRAERDEEGKRVVDIFDDARPASLPEQENVESPVVEVPHLLLGQLLCGPDDLVGPSLTKVEHLEATAGEHHHAFHARLVPLPLRLRQIEDHAELRSHPLPDVHLEPNLLVAVALDHMALHALGHERPDVVRDEAEPLGVGPAYLLGLPHPSSGILSQLLPELALESLRRELVEGELRSKESSGPRPRRVAPRFRSLRSLEERVHE
mmetsp:Transcript_13571/g.38163  ORF Transcript_13571/g.38163 Transcript_13571/m.38163 type:complete len:327 (-) Transcript_13571:481-1461(-)